jgi:hypothetical protein
MLPSKSISELIAKVRSGVFKIALHHEDDLVGSGTGFLVEGGLITNQHVLPDDGYEFAEFIFEGGEPFTLRREDLISAKLAVSSQRIRGESGPNRDYTYVEMDWPELQQRWRFQLAPTRELAPGDPVLYLGYPFDHNHLAAHQGHVASLHYEAEIGSDVLQIDGSVNVGNSGGPLLHPDTGLVEGIITEAETGLVLHQFKLLRRALEQNITLLSRNTGFAMNMAGEKSSLASHESLARLAHALRRSANVGIGYAYVIDSVRDHIHRLRTKHE